MVRDQGLSLRHIDGPKPLRLAAAEHPKAARGVPWQGRSLGYPTEVPRHYRSLTANYLDPPTSSAREGIDAVWQDHGGWQPRTVHA